MRFGGDRRTVYKKAFLIARIACATYCSIKVFATQIANAQSGTPPTVRGEYLVCPDGTGIKKRFWSIHWDSPGTIISTGRVSIPYRNWLENQYDDRKNLQNIKISSQLIIGKAPKEYDSETKEAIMNRLTEGIEIPSSYKLTNMKIEHLMEEYTDLYGRRRKRYVNVENEDYWTWKYIYTNSEGRTLTILRRGRGLGTSIIDNNGKEIGARDDERLGRLYCSNGSINLRVVTQLIPEEITNAYGEEIALPLMFWIINARTETQPPTSENTYSF